jgi:hypothetical protein
MHRYAAFLLCALPAGGLVAAPAPFSKPESWVRGWDKPVDLRGGCLFDRKGDQLTITIPGGAKDPDGRNGRQNGPRLLQDVEGDFDVQVRVSGDDRQTGEEVRQAGLFLTDGKKVVKLARTVHSDSGGLFGDRDRPTRYQLSGEIKWPTPRGGSRGKGFLAKGSLLGRPTYLRLERRGDKLWMKFSKDGKVWPQESVQLFDLQLPQKVKVGIFAEATLETTFKPVFDKFKLTKLKK